MAVDIWNLFAYYENLGYLLPYKVGFKQITYLVLKLEHFEKNDQKTSFLGTRKRPTFQQF